MFDAREEADIDALMLLKMPTMALLSVYYFFYYYARYYDYFIGYRYERRFIEIRRCRI